jgi:hypothetical protein
VQEDGSFQLADTNVDRYSMYVNGLPEGYYVKGIRSGGTDVMAAGLEVGSGVAPVEIVVSAMAGALEGTVFEPGSQKPVAGAQVVLVPTLRDHARLYRSATTDQEGRFRMRTVVPGDYKLFAWEVVDAYAWMDPDFLRSVESKGEALSIGEGSTQSVQLKTIAER